MSANDNKVQLEPWAFHAFFEKMPIIGYVVAPDWRLVAATDRLLEEIHQQREGVVGRNVFDVFPDNPDNPEADGSAVLRASLERAFASGKPEALPRQRYDAPPAAPGGEFQERYWLPENVPVLDPGGAVAYVIHTVVAAGAG